MVTTDEMDAGVLSGNLQVLVEPFYGQFKNRSADTFGTSLVIKYNLLSFGRWILSGMLESECCGPISRPALLKIVARSTLSFRQDQVFNTLQRRAWL
jgi:hypothetical protein